MKSATVMAMAALSWAALGAHAQQAGPVEMAVDFGGNEWQLSRTGQRSMLERGADVAFRASLRLCRFPADARAHIAERAGQSISQAQRMLEKLESAPILSGMPQNASAWNLAAGSAWGFTLLATEGTIGRTIGAQQIAGAWNAGQPLEIRFRERCLTAQDARSWMREARRVLRAYLGLPPA
jgi:hypothetical protein